MHFAANLVPRPFPEYLICNHKISWPPDNQQFPQRIFHAYIDLEEVLACNVKLLFLYLFVEMVS